MRWQLVAVATAGSAALALVAPFALPVIFGADFEASAVPLSILLLGQIAKSWGDAPGRSMFAAGWVQGNFWLSGKYPATSIGRCILATSGTGSSGVAALLSRERGSMDAESSAKKIVVRIANPDEIARIAELKTQVWGGESQDAWVARWAWQFRDHPWRPAQHASNFIIGEMDGRLVGGIGWIPTWLVADGKAHASAFACDGFVDPTLQRSGVGKAMFDGVLAECPWSIWMQTSAALTRYLEKNGFTRIAPANFLALPLDPSRTLRSRGWRGLGALTGWARGPIRALVRARARAIRTPTGVTLSEHSGFGDEFTRLDEALDSTGRVRPRRGAAYLRWRYTDCPFGSYQTRVARAGGELVGFVVYRASTTPSGGFGLINQLDAHPRFPGVAEALLAAAVLDLVDRDVEAIKALAPDATARSPYRRPGFFGSRRSPNVFVAPGTVETLGTTPDGARWCLSMGDCDLDFGAELVPRPQAGPP